MSSWDVTKYLGQPTDNYMVLYFFFVFLGTSMWGWGHWFVIVVRGEYAIICVYFIAEHSQHQSITIHTQLVEHSVHRYVIFLDSLAVRNDVAGGLVPGEQLWLRPGQFG